MERRVSQYPWFETFAVKNKLPVQGPEPALSGLLLPLLLIVIILTVVFSSAGPSPLLLLLLLLEKLGKMAFPFLMPSIPGLPISGT